MASYLKAIMLVGLTIAATAAGGIVKANAAKHVDDTDAAFYDSDKDEYISIAEAGEITARLKGAKYSEKGNFLLNRIQQLEPEFNKQKYLKVSYVNAGFIAPAKCDRDQRFFIRASISDLALLKCPEFRDIGRPASVSYTKDYERGYDTFSVSGVTAFTVILPGTIQPKTGAGFGYNDSALIVYAEADGEIRSNGVSSGYTRYGVNAMVEFKGAAVEAHFIDVAAYWQTDFDGLSSIYGGTVTWGLQNSRINLGGYVQADKNRYQYWVLEAEFDYFRVANPGLTGLTSADDYAWLGGHLGYVAYRKSKLFGNGLTFTADAYWFTNLNTGRDVFQAKAGININLDPKKRVSLGLDYTYGDRKEDLERENKIQLRLKFKL